MSAVLSVPTSVAVNIGVVSRSWNSKAASNGVREGSSQGPQRIGRVPVLQVKGGAKRGVKAAVRIRATQFAELSAFVAVAEQCSFRRASLQLGLSPASLSQAIRAAEERLGLRLLNRTTRSVATTEAGELLLGRLRPALDEIQSAVDCVNIYREKPVGRVRLAVAAAAADSVLGPLLGRFATAFPEIELDVCVDDAQLDIVSERFDAGIRLASEVNRDMIALRVSEPVHYCVVGAPSYFARRPVPRHPGDLVAHSCICLKLPCRAIEPWYFARSGTPLKVAVKASILVNSAELALRAAREGAGLLYLPVSMAADGIADGSLVPVLQCWIPRPSDGFVLYYTSRRQNSASLRCLIDFLQSNSRARRVVRSAPFLAEPACA